MTRAEVVGAALIVGFGVWIVVTAVRDVRRKRRKK